MSESLALTLTLNWVPDGVAGPKQRFLIEQVAWGRRRLEDLVAFFCGIQEEDAEKKRNLARNLRSRQIKPLLEEGLLAETEEGYAVDLEALHRVFVESGGEAALKGAAEAVEGERLRHSRKLEESAAEYAPGAAARGSLDAESEKRIAAVLWGELDWNELSQKEMLEAFTGGLGLVGISEDSRLAPSRGASRGEKGRTVTGSGVKGGQ